MFKQPVNNKELRWLKTIFYKVDLKISNNPKICRFLPTFFQLMLLLLKTCHSIFRPKSYYLNIKSFLQNFFNLKYIGYRWIKTQFPMHFLFGKVKMAIKISNSCIFRSKYILVLLQETYLKKWKLAVGSGEPCI